MRSEHNHPGRDPLAPLGAPRRGHDAIFVGAGINALVGAALLTLAGWDVCVLEREARLGGCIYTSDELTLPGFTHELLAAWHPLFTGSAAYAELKGELDQRGVEYLNSELPTGSVFPDGSASFIWTAMDNQVAELDRHAAGDGSAWQAMFDGFMANADTAFGLLSTELWSRDGLGLGQRAFRRLGRRVLPESRRPSADQAAFPESLRLGNIFARRTR